MKNSFKVMLCAIMLLSESAVAQVRKEQAARDRTRTDSMTKADYQQTLQSFCW